MLRDELVQTEVLFTKDLGLSLQHPQETRVEPFQNGQQFVPDPVP